MRTLADARRDFMRRTTRASMTKMLADRQCQGETIVPCYPETRIVDIDALAGPLPKRLTLAVLQNASRVTLQYHIRDISGGVGALTNGPVESEPIEYDDDLTVADVNRRLEEYQSRGVNLASEGSQRMMAELAEGVDEPVRKDKK